MSERRGDYWQEPKNLTAPINSAGHEASVTVSADGKMIFFTRCEKMDQRSATGCAIYVSRKKGNGQWDEPSALPDFINTGNSQTPRIMADGETLYFASDKMPGSQGGMDLYVTRLKETTWSKPLALDFANTEKDDQYVSVTALGRYLLRDTKGSRKNELVEYLIPG
ncbi:MAG: exo-alpha-sialidase [Bacteroidia bacterium]|nr:exo-alpha-sialidase [Bacteroidia bacterium]